MDTASYVLLTTAPTSELARALPAFLEASLNRHRMAAGTVRGAPALPAPADRMPVLLFADRAQWAQFTRQALPSTDNPLLAIEVGGYSAGGRAVLFDLGPGRERLALMIAAHEGWHQYVQRTFRQRPPTWADEMLAVLAEGFEGQPGRYRFAPASNELRRAHLAGLIAQGRLGGVAGVLDQSPTELLADDPRSTIDYYARLWALGLFLRSDGALWRGVADLLRDAAAGRMLRELGHPDPESIGRLSFERYVGRSAGSLDLAYAVFARSLVADGPALSSPPRLPSASPSGAAASAAGTPR